jgi:L-seryl-tRNA(Ser) seleniumtransferase
MERLFPGHGFLVVNNNAAATMLCLRALSRGREVIVSRGELVEIGGSFRVPDILAASGARLREVGTTNRTRVADFEAAVTNKTGLLLKVHTSNFRIVGFTESPTIASLARLANRKGIPLVVDWGSGDLIDLGPLGIHDEMPARDVLEAGADLVTFSGDKLLGGPQAGFVVGRGELIAKLRRDPLARVCRLDRLLVSALGRTLAAYVTGRAFDEVPTLRMLSISAATIGRRARTLARQVSDRTGEGSRLSVVQGESRTGGGTSPAGERPTFLIAITSPDGDAGNLERRLRVHVPPVIGRMHEGRLLLDLRTVLPEQDELLLEVLATTLRR